MAVINFSTGGVEAKRKLRGYHPSLPGPRLLTPYFPPLIGHTRSKNLGGLRRKLRIPRSKVSNTSW